MKKFLLGSALAFALGSTSVSAAPFHAQADLTRIDAAGLEQIWLAKGGNGNGNAKADGPKQPKKAQGRAGEAKKSGKDKGHAGNGKDKPAKEQQAGGKGKADKGNGKAANAGGPNPKPARDKAAAKSKPGKGRHVFTREDRDSYFERVRSARGPEGRDMVSLLAASALGFLTPQLAVATLPEDEIITYRNCPPGLAKKNPPCVPPGLARDGVTYEQWASYDPDDYDRLWVERRDAWLDRERDVRPNPDLLLLRSDQIATLYDLDRAPDGYRYGLIDGMPVLLDDDDYRSLLVVNERAQVTDLMAGAPVVPTAALTQDEMVDLYRLPQPGADQNYAVVNGQLVQLNNSNYEMLQMIRIARAVL